MSNEQERINKIEEQIKELKNQKKILQNKQRAKEKKENTKRMIELAAIAEEIFNCQGIEPENFRKLLTDAKKAWNKQNTFQTARTSLKANQTQTPKANQNQNSPTNTPVKPVNYHKGGNHEG